MESNKSVLPMTKILPESKIVAIITYTASLSSSPLAVDQLLDTLRRITAQGSSTYSPQDIESMHTLQQKLEEYIVEHEPIRSFTYESLHLHIDRRFAGNRRLTILRVALFGTLAVAFGLGVGSLSLPLSIGDEAKKTIAISVLYSVIYFAAGVFFFGAIKEFTKEARQTYMYICLAMFTLGVAVLIQPSIGIAGLQHEPIIPTVITVPLTIAFGLLYIGVKKIAKLAGTVSTRLTSTRFLSVLVAILLLACFILPLFIAELVNNPLPTPYITGGMVFQGLATLLMAVSATILYQANKGLTKLYAHAMKGLITAVACNVIVSSYLVFYWLLVGEPVTNIYLRIGVVLLVVVALLYLRAAYIFNKMHRYEI